MALAVPSIFSRLPPELLCAIFEHAATNDTPTALALSLVSPYTRTLVQPFLYHTVVLNTARAVHAFLATLALHPPAFPRSRVKHLGVFAVGPIGSILAVLARCRGVQSLACAFHVQQCKGSPGTGPPYDVSGMQALDCTTEQHLLGMSCRDGWDARSVGPSVTHLRVHLPASSMAAMFPPPPPVAHPAQGPPEEADDEEQTQGWNKLARLPNLTHLAVVCRPSARYPIATIFEHLARLLEPAPGPVTASTAAPTAALAAPPRLALVLVQIVGSSVAPSPAIHALNTLALRSAGVALRIVAERAPRSAAVQWERAVRHDAPSVWRAAELVVRERLQSAAGKGKA